MKSALLEIKKAALFRNVVVEIPDRICYAAWSSNKTVEEYLKDQKKTK